MIVHVVNFDFVENKTVRNSLRERRLVIDKHQPSGSSLFTGSQFDSQSHTEFNKVIAAAAKMSAGVHKIVTSCCPFPFQ